MIDFLMSLQREPISNGFERIRILMLAPNRVVGGITTWLANLMKYSGDSRLDYRVIDTSKLYHSLGERRDFRAVLIGVVGGLERLLRLLAALLEYKPHLVYLTCSPSIGFRTRDVFYLYLLKLLRKRIVVHMHGGDPAGFFGRNKFSKHLIVSALKGVCMVIVISRDMEKAAEMYLESTKVVYFPNMIDDDLVESASVERKTVDKVSGHFRLLHVGYQCEEKGSLDLIKAVAELGTPVTCCLVGDVGLKNREVIENLISELGLEGKVRLYGKRRGEDLKSIYLSSDIFVFPSHSEGFPNVILEAMAYGLPIIATDVGNIPEMIGAESDSAAGVILRRSELPAEFLHVELARLIDGVANNYELRRKFSFAGPHRVRRFYLASHVVPRLEELLASQLLIRHSEG